MGILLMLLTLLGVQSRGVADGSSEIALKLQWREFTINYCRTDDDANLGSIRVVGMLMYENRLRRPANRTHGVQSAYGRSIPI